MKLSLLIALAIVCAPRVAHAQTQRSAYEELQTFSGVLNHIRLNYPDSLSYSALVAAAIRGVLPPFLSRVRTRLGVAAATDSLLEQRLARMLATRAAEVRWGPDAREEFLLRNDRTIRVALEQFPRLRELLAAPNPKQEANR
jgi:hypothetical protein